MVQAREGGVPIPTRWKGNRVVDYIITNSVGRIKGVTLDSIKLSDHKAVKSDLDHNSHSKPEWGGRSHQPYNPRTGTDAQTWWDTVDQAWKEVLEDPDHAHKVREM